MTIPDYSNIRFSMADMERFFQDGNVQLDNKSKQKLNTIFQNCDKRDTEGKKVKGGDGELTGKERDSFMKKIKKKMPELYSQVVDFFVTVDVVEDQNKQKAAQTSLKDVQKSHENNRRQLRIMQQNKRIDKWIKKTEKQMGELKEKSLEELQKYEEEFQQQQTQEEIKRILDQENK